ncbi:PERF protein, partial [Atlantisia rogersi]|nr:PERF protein [Atlantisia rogersi]
PCECGCPASPAVTGECCSRQRGLARVTVTALSGEGWRGDVFTPTDAYVKLFLGGTRAQTATVWNNNRPRWGVPVDLGVTPLPPGARLRLEVWDEDNKWDDDLLGVCEVGLEAGEPRDGVCYPGSGRLRFRYRVTCGPALAGPECRQYRPRPPQSGEGVTRVSHWPPR